MFKIIYIKQNVTYYIQIDQKNIVQRLKRHYRKKFEVLLFVEESGCSGNKFVLIVYICMQQGF